MTLHDVTPIARLTGEYEVIVVPAASPFRIARRSRSRAFKERPESISWGGGSAGGSDQILAGLIADAVGVDRGASTTSPSRAAANRCRRFSAARCRSGINGLAEFAPQIDAGTRARARASRAPSACPVSTRRRCASRASTSSSRTGARVVAPPGHQRRRSAAARSARSRRWCSPRRMARGARALPLDRSLPGRRRVRARSSTAEEARVRAHPARSSAPAADDRHATPRGRIRCWCSPAWRSSALVAAAARCAVARERGASSAPRQRRRAGRPIALIARRHRARRAAARARGIRHRVHGALLADRARVRSAASRARRAVRARRLGRRLPAVRSRAAADAAGRRPRAAGS